MRNQLTLATTFMCTITPKKFFFKRKERKYEKGWKGTITRFSKFIPFTFSHSSFVLSYLLSRYPFPAL